MSDDTPEMSTQDMLDRLADNGILTSVVYGPREEETTDERYFSVTIFLRAEKKVSNIPKQATSYIEAVRLAYEIAREFKWIK